MALRAPQTGDKWSPYGHEKARRQALMQRHAWLAIGAIAVAMFYGGFLSLTFSQETQVDGGQTIDIEKSEQKPMTVTVAPGRAPAFASQDAQEPEGIAAPGVERDEGNALVAFIRPFLPVVAPLVGALWLLSRVGASARGKLAELNFGVYKGAMPYEMHTAKRYKQIFTHRLVDEHVFGKRREDFIAGTYLKDPPISVRRLLGTVDYEEAGVTRLRQGGKRPRRAASAAAGAAGSTARSADRSAGHNAGRAPTRPHPRPDSVAGRLWDAWNEEGLTGVVRAARREHASRQALRLRVRKVHKRRQALQREAAARAAAADTETA